jgi:hypothetical protein
VTINDLALIGGSVLTIVVSICFIPLMMFVVFPFFERLSSEKRLEKFVDNQCLRGNEIAILVRREGNRYYDKRDYKLIRAAIEGNEHAIKALKLDPESRKNKNY